MTGGATQGSVLRRRSVLASLGVLFVAKLAVSLAGADRGLDIGDDGVFLLALNEPATAPPLFEFYKLLTHVDPPLRFDVVGIRLLRIAAELVATLALARAVFVWARPRFPGFAERGFLAFVSIASLGTLLSVGARGFGYNDATNFVVFLACACLFRLLALPSGPGARAARYVWSAAAGFAIGFQLFVKFPPAFLLAVAALGVVWLPRGSARTRLAGSAAMAAGAAAAIGLFVSSNGGVAPLVTKWKDAAELNRIAGYGIREILSIYYWNDYGSHVNGLRLWVCFAAVFALARWLLRRRSDASDLALTAALVAGACVLAWGAWTFHAVNVHPSLIALFCLVLLLAPVTWVLGLVGWRSEVPRGEAFGPLLLLLALPFVAILGTNVALTLKLPAHAAPVFLMLAISLLLLASQGYPRFAATALTLLAVVTSAVFVEHQVFRPYGLPSPIYAQTLATPLLPGLRVDRATRALLEELHERMSEAGFRPGDPVIAFDFMPGLVYAIGGRSPGLPFFAFDKPAQNCWAIERAKLDERPFLILGQDMLVEQHACIRAFAFPEEFRLVATLRNPYEAPIRYFFGGPPMPYLRVFAPDRRTDE